MRYLRLILCALLFVFAANLGATPCKIISPSEGATLATPLTAVLQWEYQLREDYPLPYTDWRVTVSTQTNLAEPLVTANLKDGQTELRVAVKPETKYFWRIMPFELKDGKEVEHPELAGHGSFTSGRITNKFNAPDSERYANPRTGAHWEGIPPIVAKLHEPLSPWYAIKAYNSPPPPKLGEIKGKFPQPIWDGHPEALEAYWYCWETILRVWTYAPFSQQHQAVNNLIGYPNWGPWGSTMVWDTCFMLHFARYGQQAYSFISGLDNCYARQHENGFICRESDKDNREVYVWFPVNPPLFAWAEWEHYLISKDKERLARVFLPIVKQYEWILTYQRRENGLYWTQGVQEADDSPRNALMYYAASATSYQGLAALNLARMCRELGRTDLAEFFDAQHAELKKMINDNFWDEAHHIYNDLTQDKKFITELQPGVFCKHVHMFWPMVAGLSTPERAAGMVEELKNPKSFNRLTGVPSLSADSKDYNAANGQYWKGAVWPPTQCMVQEGLAETGHEDYLQPLAEKYYNACLAAFKILKTMNENLAPDQVQAFGAPDFVGWSGIGPVGNLIEHILGFDIDVPKNRITWKITRLERHGLENLYFGGGMVSLVCAEHKAGEACQLTVNCTKGFTLQVKVGDKVAVKEMLSGENRVVVGRE